MLYAYFVILVSSDGSELSSRENYSVEVFPVQIVSVTWLNNV